MSKTLDHKPEQLPKTPPKEKNDDDHQNDSQKLHNNETTHNSTNEHTSKSPVKKGFFHIFIFLVIFSIFR